MTDNTMNSELNPLQTLRRQFSTWSTIQTQTLHLKKKKSLSVWLKYTGKFVVKAGFPSHCAWAVVCGGLQVCW